LSSCFVLEWTSQRVKSIFGSDDELKGQEYLGNAPRRRVGAAPAGYGAMPPLPMMGQPPMVMPDNQQMQFNPMSQPAPMGVGGMGGGSSLQAAPIGLPPVYNSGLQMGQPPIGNMFSAGAPPADSFSQPAMQTQNIMSGGGYGGAAPNNYGMPQQQGYNPYAAQQNNQWAAMPPPSNMISNISYTPGGLFPAAQAPGYGPVSPYVTSPMPQAYQPPQQVPEISYDDQLPANTGVAYGPPAIGSSASQKQVDEQLTQQLSDNYNAISAQEEAMYAQPQAPKKYSVPDGANTDIQIPPIQNIENVNQAQVLSPTSEIGGLPPLDDPERKWNDNSNYNPNQPMMPTSQIPRMQPVDNYIPSSIQGNGQMR